MITIVEPKQCVDRLWGKQRVQEDRLYRMMRYVLRVDHDDKVLLHNAITGRLAVLDQAEADVLDTLPSVYKPEMEPLISGHYLVPDDYDEHQQVLNLRLILQRFMLRDPSGPEPIMRYTILPTSACNARCYYCYEHGVRKVTMTEQTADDVVRFIAEHCDGKEIAIRWFGGEPTVAAHRIDQICEGLLSRGVRYSSTMTTNGYLFDEEMVLRAKSLWHLTSAMISVDGTEAHYNEIKDFADARDNPYQRVLGNIGLLLDAGILVAMRMNFDVGNYRDFRDLLEEAKKRYHGHKLLRVYAFPVKGEYPSKDGEVHHGGLEWSVDRLVELNDMACAAGLFHRRSALPSLFFTCCAAGDPSSMVISPEGNLARCTSIFEREDQVVGTVADGFAVQDYCGAWRRLADPAKCSDCALFPSCVLVAGCPGGTDCFQREAIRKFETAITDAYRHMKSDGKEDITDGFSETDRGVCPD